MKKIKPKHEVEENNNDDYNEDNVDNGNNQE